MTRFQKSEPEQCLACYTPHPFTPQNPCAGYKYHKNKPPTPFCQRHATRLQIDDTRQKNLAGWRPYMRNRR